LVGEDEIDRPIGQETECGTRVPGTVHQCQARRSVLEHTHARTRVPLVVLQRELHAAFLRHPPGGADSALRVLKYEAARLDDRSRRREPLRREHRHDRCGAAEDDDRDVYLYINSPGGSVTAGMAIYDTMQVVPCDVATTCMGLAASMGQFLLCAGTPGKRFALPHARILMHQPSAQMQGVASDIAIHAEQIVYTKRIMAERIAFHTGQSVEQVEADSDRDRWFTAEQAKDYGMIDAVIERAKQVVS